MQKNVSGQKVGAQMISATDGSAFTGSVTVAVTVDAGTQATGSVGSGACTHEGGGYHTYAPAQAETNGDLIAFTFSGTGAVPQTVQVYTRAATPDVNVTQFGGSNGTFSGGRPEVNTSHAAGTAWNSGAIGASTLASDTITAAKIAADAITAAKIADGAIDAGAFAADAITAAKLAADVTTELQNGLATASALSTVEGKIDELDTNVDTLLTRLSSTRAGYLDSLNAPALPNGEVVSDGGNSATSFVTDRTESTDDYWKDALLLLTSGVLTGQVKKVTAYNGTTKAVTVENGFTGTPAAGVTFLLVNN